MLYYLLFLTILGFIFHFYIIFGTNLLTGGPAQNCCFFCLFQCFEEKELEKLFLEGKQPRELGVHVRGDTGCPRGWGGVPTPWVHPLPREHPGGPPAYPLHPYIPTYRKTSRTENRSGVPLPETSVATENQSRPIPAPCRRGQSFSGGHLHHPGAIHDKEGVVHPRG